MDDYVWVKMKRWHLEILHGLVYDKKIETVGEIFSSDDPAEKKILRKYEDRLKRIDLKLTKGLMQFRMLENRDGTGGEV